MRIFTRTDNLWARFVNPENQQILAEYCLGIELEGRKIFYESELGFDPSKQKWAISIVIEKI
ncbi:MAG: hypothetical protein HC887_12395 [Desulfobacteraceae bacterium]|nr:hypothetical protein [Desulfobacteraceae bacterium]